MVSSPTRSNWVGLSATVHSFSSISLSLWEQNPTSAITSWGFLFSGKTTTPTLSSSSPSPLWSEPGTESLSQEVGGTRVIPWGFMSWNQAMILPSRLAFAANAEDEDGSWLPHVVESVVSVEEKRPVEELLQPGATGMGTEAPYARWWLSPCCTGIATPVAAEYWLLMLPSFTKLSPNSSSSELLREALGGTSMPGALCSSLEGREVPIAPSEASLASTSWLDTLPTIPESWSDSWIARRMLGSSSSSEPRPCKNKRIQCRRASAVFKLNFKYNLQHLLLKKLTVAADGDSDKVRKIAAAAVLTLWHTNLKAKTVFLYSCFVAVSSQWVLRFYIFKTIITTHSVFIYKVPAHNIAASLSMFQVIHAPTPVQKRKEKENPVGFSFKYYSFINWTFGELVNMKPLRIKTTLIIHSTKTKMPSGIISTTLPFELEINVYSPS